MAHLKITLDSTIRSANTKHMIIDHAFPVCLGLEMSPGGPSNLQLPDRVSNTTWGT